MSDDPSVSTGTIQEVLPSSVKTLGQYYVHVVSLFVPTAFDLSIARFAQLALDAYDEEGEHLDEQDGKDLWTKLFRSYAAVGDYEKAYRAIMDTPYHETLVSSPVDCLGICADSPIDDR